MTSTVDALTTVDKKKTNWLLMALLVVSVAVHAVILVRVAGIYASKDVEYIELEMQEKQPEARNIPTPPRRRNPEPPPVPREITPVQAVAPKAPPKAPTVAPARPKVVEQIAAPTRIDTPPPAVTAWTPPAPPPKESGRFATTNDYFSMVRMKIESRKRYPFSSRRNQQEGKVVVRFTILPDGSVRGLELAGACSYESLNEAALKAVRSASPFSKPPPKLFNGPVLVEIAIVFELT
jgi:protein TonB